MFAYMIFPPKVPMVHGATPATVSAATTSATSVPFAATATANQVCSFTALFLKQPILTGLVPTALTHVHFPLRSVGAVGP